MEVKLLSDHQETGVPFSFKLSANTDSRFTVKLIITRLMASKELKLSGLTVSVSESVTDCSSLTLVFQDILLLFLVPPFRCHPSTDQALTVFLLVACR